MDNKSRSPTCQVQFTKLEFGKETPTPDVAYHQIHCRVIIDSRLNSRITGAKPERTRASEKETTVTVSGKTTETKSGSGTIRAQHQVSTLAPLVLIQRQLKRVQALRQNNLTPKSPSRPNSASLGGDLMSTTPICNKAADF